MQTIDLEARYLDPKHHWHDYPKWIRELDGKSVLLTYPTGFVPMKLVISVVQAPDFHTKASVRLVGNALAGPLYLRPDQCNRIRKLNPSGPAEFILQDMTIYRDCRVIENATGRGYTLVLR